MVKAFPSADAKRKVDVHVWWTSIEVACQENDTLHQLCSDYNITPKRLLKYMKKADPNLVRRRIDVKLDLTKIQKERRKVSSCSSRHHLCLEAAWQGPSCNRKDT
jgi:hypothetical protein